MALPQSQGVAVGSPETIRDQFEHVAKRFTETADLQFDQDGNPIKVTQKEKKVRKQRDPLAADDSIVIVDRGNGTVLDDDDSSADNGKPSRKSREDDGDYEDGLFD